MGDKIQDKPHPLTLARTDSWFSNVTGLGGVQDKGASLQHRKDRPISRALAESLWSDSGIGAAIIEEILNDAFSPGWEITLSAADDTPQSQRDAAAKAAEINTKLAAWHDRTRFITELRRHKGQTRAYGGSILRLGVDDGGEATDPLGDIRSFDWVQTFDRFDATGSGAPVADPSSVHFAFPTHYLIGTILAGQTSQSELARQLQFSQAAIQERTTLSLTARSAAQSQIVHADRVWRSDGPFLSNRTRIENDGWGQSAFQRVFNSVKGWGSTQQNIRHIVQDFIQIAYGLKGFQQLMLANSEDAIRKRFALMDRIRSIVNAIIYDADNETANKISSNVTGLPDLVDRIMLDVSAASRIPITRLFGVSPGGFGTGESEGLNWRQQVEGYREDDLRPALRYAYGLLFQTPEFSMVPEGWGIQFGAIDSPTEEQQATNRKLVAETDSIYVTTGVLDATEVTASRFGGAEYSAETTVSLEEPSEPSEGVTEEAERLNAEAAQAGQPADTVEPVADVKPQETAMAAGQITTLIDLAERVADKKLPLETAIQIALLGYKELTPESARALLAPAEGFERPPSPTPPGLSPIIESSAPAGNTTQEPPDSQNSR